MSEEQPSPVLVPPDQAADAPRRASAPLDGGDPVGRLASALGPGPHALILLFCGAGGVPAALLRRAHELFDRAVIAGCTTAGEIAETGYAEGQVVALAFPASSFAVETVLIDPVDTIDSRSVIARLQRARQSLQHKAECLPHELGILLVDGLSGREEHLIASLAGGLGPVPIIGGSAGDDRQFVQTQVFLHQHVRSRAAVLCLLRSRLPLRTFSFSGCRPSRVQMVVTRADPARRAVLDINDEPAAAEYARLLGMPVDSLGPELFATRPVMVRAGGRHHVRSIQHAGADGSLTFFGAVAEGMVLTLSAESRLVPDLATSLAQLRTGGTPRMVLGFDCIFRRMEAESRQQTAEVSRLLAEAQVTGFSTYGEQFGTMHVNQTLTGVAFYDPGMPA